MLACLVFGVRRLLLSRRSIFLPLSLSLTIVAVGAEAQTVLRRGTANEPRTLDPHYVQGNAGAALMYDMFEGLFTVAANGEIAPGVAESWSASSDGITYTFKLRDGAKFSDGQPITAEDFVWSFRRAVDPKAATRAARVMFPIKNARAIVGGRLPSGQLGVAAPDPKTVVITLEQPTPYFIELMVSFSAAVLPRQTIEKNGDAWTQPANMVTSGAYTLGEFVSNSYIKLVKNKNFHAAASVAIDELFYYPIERPETALTRFRAGELDIVFNIPPNRLDFVKENFAKEFRSAPVSGVYYILLNNERPPLNDVRVRKALSLSIDREVIVNGIVRTGDSIAWTVVPRAMTGYGENTPPHAAGSVDERLKQAQTLLAEAGFGPANPLKINYKTGGQEINRRIAVAVQSMWKRVGVEAEIENVGAGTIVQDSASGNFQAMRYTYYAAFEDPVSFLNLLETGNTINFSRYANPQFDALLAEADKIMDPTARIAKLKEAELVAMAEHPVIPIYFQNRFYLVSQRVKNWQDNARGENLVRYLAVQ
jgi:oligopeptide transport system substrate-binding protein